MTDWADEQAAELYGDFADRFMKSSADSPEPYPTELIAQTLREAHAKGEVAMRERAAKEVQPWDHSLARGIRALIPESPAKGPTE